MPIIIKFMIEPRAFCATLFDEDIRKTTKPINDDLLTRCISLITLAQALFARARPVIPELQQIRHLKDGDANAHLNLDAQRVLYLTEDMRRSFNTSLHYLGEESACSKLAEEGGKEQRSEEARQERIASPRLASRYLLQHNTRLSRILTQIRTMTHQHRQNASAPNNPTTPLGSSDLLASSSELQRGLVYRDKMKIADYSTAPDKDPTSTEQVSRGAKPLSIPTFVPQGEHGSSEPLVWSPTSGTRPRGPNEIFQRLESKSPIHTIGHKKAVNASNQGQTHPRPENRKAEKLAISQDLTTSTGDVLRQTAPYRVPPSKSRLGSPIHNQRRGNGSPFRRRVQKASTNDSLSLDGTIARQKQDQESGANLDFDPLFISDSEIETVERRYSDQEISDIMYENAFGNKQNWKPTASSTPTRKSNRKSPLDFSGSSSRSYNSLNHTAQSSLSRLTDRTSSHDELRSESDTSSSQQDRGQDPRLDPHSAYYLPWLDPRHRQTRQSPSTPGRPEQQGLNETPPNSPFHEQLKHVDTRKTNAKNALIEAAMLPSLTAQIARPHKPQTTYRGRSSFIPPFLYNNPPDNSPKPITTAFPEPLTLPPRGTLSHIEYWNLLHRRSTEINSLLSKLPTPMSDAECAYIAGLAETRITTIAASKMPNRGGKSAWDWLKVLEEELRLVQTGNEQSAGVAEGWEEFSNVMRDRKSDYEIAVRRAIEEAEREVETMKGEVMVRARTRGRGRGRGRGQRGARGRSL